MGGKRGDNAMKRDIDEYLRALLKGIPILLLAVAIGVVAGYIVSEILIGPKYEAVTSVTFYPAESGSGSPMVLQLTGADREAEKEERKSCAEVLGSAETCEAVIERLRLAVDGQTMPASRLMSMVRVPVPEDSDNFLIYVTDTVAKRAEDIAAACAEIGAERLAEVFPGSQARDMSFSGIRVTDIGPDRRIFMAAGGVLGFVASLLLLLLMFLSDDTIRTARDVERCLGVETIGVIPYVKGE